MEVVNVKVSWIRPLGYKNLKEWIQDPQNIYIGRRSVVFVDGIRFPASDSKWANPYTIKKHGSRDQVMALYRKYIERRIQEGEITADQLQELWGKRLGCWCAPEACHGNILKELAHLHYKNKSDSSNNSDSGNNSVLITKRGREAISTSSPPTAVEAEKEVEETRKKAKKV
ncbi:hypothetical protein BX616_010998 [Lobosporangium transversale]|uniref:DUF4326 domain-containing protein n=1 Tax=Lobosporangium transversale TaxID=64571 RepID=A0A1Y2H244_9FUNG|nr:hypothetical protein BCR41DRAFT_343770 [Lobosporangium transversale]KAF9909970.1 hypothetical protein BX616_010998 [Lobosporangium transversale]ORZ28605.1 hypothetical protein BCR41DRAFT_343770 [Lobosporangium transversale]|eukprot:XP_021886278.1 hypothetical protein BCR41DRAFT_343770 [Lobosporangium transversale]